MYGSQVPLHTSRPSIESTGSSPPCDYNGNDAVMTQLPAASQDTHNHPTFNRSVSEYASSAPPLPPKPAIHHSPSYSVGGSATTHSPSPSISVTPSDDAFSFFSSSRRPERDTSLSGTSATSIGTTPQTTSPVAMTTSSYTTPPVSASLTGVSSPTSVVPAAPTALPDWVPPHLQRHYAVPSTEPLPRGSIEHDHGQDFVDDDFSLHSEDADDFFNSSLLSHIAVKLRDKVPRETHVKGGIPYHNAFTGRDVVVCSRYMHCGGAQVEQLFPCMFHF